MDYLEQMQWKKRIKGWATELGFVSVGFTTAEPIDSLAPLLEARIEQGAATTFESKDIQRRIDPQAVWQDCKTVVALAYPLPSTFPPQKGEGVIARSAVGEDYHRVVFRKINLLVDTMLIKGWAEAPHFQVDTGPLVERAFAARAGIGWIGRNQHLIVPGVGTFVALALLLLDQEIPPDEAFISSQCGTCQKCIQACPAQIIGKEPFAANKCVSYLTQSKEVLTAEESSRLGFNIFGCDTCQEVCPHNSKWLLEEPLSASLKRGVDLLETLNLTKGKFLKHFKMTAAGWRGKGVLQRNAFVGMRNHQGSGIDQWLDDHKKVNLIPKMILPYLQDAGNNSVRNTPAFPDDHYKDDAKE